MTRPAPIDTLATHDVLNQPPDLVGFNLYLADPALCEAARREGGDWVGAPLVALGAEMGTEDASALATEANRFPPELLSFDARGRRLDEVRFHPSYHALMETGMRHAIHSVAWTAGLPGAHVLHAALLAMFSEVEQGTMCPLSMTYAAVPALRHAPVLAEAWLPKLLGGRYDASVRPFAEKRGITLGMAMTEKQGGSDVRATRTQARPAGPDGRYVLLGHKWFCSAPMCDGFLTLAQAPGGLSCFLAPRVTEAGARNAIHLMRLKDKLGNRSNASAEIEYHDAEAYLVGEEGRGIQTIIAMVHGTRLDTMASTLGIMRRALAEAAHHTIHRQAFGRRLIDQPAMRAVLADLQLDYEAAAALTMRLARAFDGPSPGERALARLGVALGKYWLTKRVSGFVVECMEVLGGSGYVEESVLPRLYREAPVNAIWEGSGNVIALDVLRTLAREPAALDAVRAEVAPARGHHPGFDRAADALDRLDPAALGDGDARGTAERLALLLQGALLLRHTPAPVAEAFTTLRFAPEAARLYGALPNGIDLDPILARIMER